MKTYIIILLFFIKSALLAQGTFNNLYNVNHPYTTVALEIMKYKQSLYVINRDEQYCSSLMVLDSLGNASVSYILNDTTQTICPTGDGMLMYKNQIIVAGACFKTDSVYNVLIILDTNFNHINTIYLRTGNYEYIERMTVVGDYLILKNAYSNGATYDARYMKLDSNYNVVWNKYYTNTKVYGNRFNITSDIDGNIITIHDIDTLGSIEDYIIKLDKNTGNIIKKVPMRNTSNDDYHNIIFTSLDHRIIVTNSNFSIEIYDESFNLLTYKSGVYWRRDQITDGFEVEDGFVFCGGYSPAKNGAFMGKTDKNGNKIWERYLTRYSNTGAVLYKSCRSYNEGYAFCGFIDDSAGWQSAWVVSVDSAGCWGAGDSCNNKYYYTDTFSSVGIAELPNQEGNMNLVIYPNPSSDFINIEVSRYKYQDIREIKIEIYDAIGNNVNGLCHSEERGVYDGELHYQLNIQKLNKGIYFIRILDKDNKVIANGKFICR